MNYYKQGDAAKADKINAAFEKLGYKNRCNYTFASRGNIYFTISKDDYLYTLGIDFIELFRNNPDYQELELPVEPKFKAEDWLVYKNGCTFCGGLKALQVQTVEKDRYIFTNGTKGAQRFIDSECRLWTIQDAKDGDVLVNDAGCIFINAGFEKDDKVTLACYCYVSVQGIFYEEDYKTGSWLYASHIHPATKEQRDLLFNKMKEAGYECDERKKKLHKIKPHYDIANFQPFDKVLVRDTKYCNWNVNLFSYYIDDIDARIARFHCINSTWIQCIPFNEETKHLLGTTDTPPDEYINW